MWVMSKDGRVLGEGRLPNDQRRIVEYVWKFGWTVHAAIEVSTGSAALEDVRVEELGWILDLAYRGYVHRLKQSPNKSDHSDARLSADSVRVRYLPEMWLAPPAVRQLRGTVRYRQQIANQRSALKLRLEASLRSHRYGIGPGVRWTRGWIAGARGEAALPISGRWVPHRLFAGLERLIRERTLIEKQLEAMTEDDAIVGHLWTFAGVGPVTAWTIRGKIGRFDRFRGGKQLARFCELSPRNASSDARQTDAGLVKACHGPLRGGAHRGRAPSDALRSALADVRRGAPIRETRKRRRGGGGKPMASLAVSSDATVRGSGLKKRIQ